VFFAQACWLVGFTVVFLAGFTVGISVINVKRYVFRIQTSKKSARSAVTLVQSVSKHGPIEKAEVLEVHRNAYERKNAQ
jgi:hypothetical protein